MEAAAFIQDRAASQRRRPTGPSSPGWAALHLAPAGLATVGPAPEPVAEPATIVLFGATGDLFRRKLLPALYTLFAHDLVASGTHVVATSPDELDDREFSALARAAIAEHSSLSPHGPLWERFSASLTYARACPTEGDLAALADAVQSVESAGARRRLFYLAVPPSAFPAITQALVDEGLCDHARVVYEKPFGETPARFRNLLMMVRTILSEEQVYTIDHYLAKEAVRQVMQARFWGPRSEREWSRDTIAQVQIDVPETVGVGARAGFYDGTGALKDMVMTHLLNLMAVVAMDAPESSHPRGLCDERAKLLAAVQPLSPELVIRGQYDGYQSVAQIRPGSQTETFIAARVSIDNDRWAGVPFLLRTGKRMAADRQSIRILFKPSGADRRGDCLGVGAETMRFDLRAAPVVAENRPSRGSRRLPALGAYENVLLAALRGERDGIVRADAMQRTWEIARPVLDDPPAVRRYAQGSWGPAAADLLPSPLAWPYAGAGVTPRRAHVRPNVITRGRAGILRSPRLRPGDTFGNAGRFVAGPAPQAPALHR